MNLTFNIIFVPGMVRFFRLAIVSLLKHSPYKYRLVSNGLGRKELELLRAFCRSSDRLELYVYPTRTPLPHGTVLNLLHHREDGDFFCFMDPDIFAAGPFAAALEAHLHDVDVFSSCTQIWVKEDQYVGLQGRCLRSPSGLELPTTFFAVYRNEPLRRVIAETGVGFEKYSYGWMIPQPIHERFDRLGWPRVDKTDSTKLLGLLLNACQLRLKHRPLEELLHIGGIGTNYLRNKLSHGLPQMWRRFVQRPYVLDDAELSHQPSNRHLFSLRRRRKRRMLSDVDLQRIQETARHRWEKDCVTRFFTNYLCSVFDGTPEPILDISDDWLAGRIRKACAVIRELHDETTLPLAA